MRIEYIYKGVSTDDGTQNQTQVNYIQYKQWLITNYKYIRPYIRDDIDIGLYNECKVDFTWAIYYYYYDNCMMIINIGTYIYSKTNFQNYPLLQKFIRERETHMASMTINRYIFSNINCYHNAYIIRLKKGPSFLS